MTEALVFVDDLDDPELSTTDRHHLEHVLRLRRGALVTVSDGRGRHRVMVLADPLEAAGPVQSEPRPEPELAVAFALVKGARPELVVQKLTELGIDRIILFAADRSVVRWDESKRDRETQRLRRIAREAAMQCRRVLLPEIEAPTTFAAVAARPGAALAERGAVTDPRAPVTLVLVGPEGGWSVAEAGWRPAGTDADLARVDLGPHVLRAETAAIAAGVLLTAGRAARSGGTWWASTVA